MRFTKPFWLLALFAAVLFCGCADREAEERELIGAQLEVIDKGLQSADQRNLEFQARMDSLESILARMDAEVSARDLRIGVAGQSAAHLRVLLLGEEVEPVAVAPPTKRSPVFLLIIALLLIGLWMLWRARNRKIELKMSREIDQVIDKLADKARQEKTGSAAAPNIGSNPQPAPIKEDAKNPPAPASVPKPASGIEKAEPPAAPARVTSGPKEAAPAPEPATPKPAPAPAKPPEPARAGGRDESANKKAEKPSPQSTGGSKDKKTPAKKAASKEPSSRTVKKTDKTEPSAKKTPAGKDGRKKVARRAPAKKCKVAGCQNKHRSKGFCNKHYQQWRKGLIEDEADE